MLIPCQLPNKPRYWTQTDADCGALPGFISRIRNKLYIHEFNLMVLLSMSTARRSMLEVSTRNHINPTSCFWSACGALYTQPIPRHLSLISISFSFA